MSGQKIISGLKDALAWAQGEGTRAVTWFENGVWVTREMTLEEWRDLMLHGTPAEQTHPERQEGEG